MRCVTCNAVLPDDAEFCPSCNSMLESADAKSDRAESETPGVTIISSAPPYDPLPALPDEKRPNRLLLIVIAVVAVMLAIQLVTMTVAHYRRPKPPINAAPLLLDREQGTAPITMPDKSP